MKKVAIGLLASLLIAAVLVAGCGGSKTTSKPVSSKAQDILTTNQGNMQDVKYVKMKGTATVNTPGAEVKTETTQIEAEMKVNGPKDSEVYMKTTESSGAVSEVYVQDGYAYTYEPNAGWSKMKVDSGGGLSSGNFTPEAISDLTKFAQAVTMKPEQNGKYVITFDLGDKFFTEMLNQAGSTSGTTPSSAEQSAGQQLSQTMGEMLKGIQMNVVYTVDKKTLLGDKVTIDVSMKNAPALGDMSANITATFYDYGVPVTITLPPEAQNAPERQPGPGGLPNIPSIPGLGL
jgi:hypothetical protein